MFRALVLCGVTHMLTNLLLVLQAKIGADVHFLIYTVSLENFTGGMGSAAFVAYLSGLCNVAYTATQYALLSSLSGFPLRQDLAVTGSVDQQGSIQPVGGLNEKIEAFFDICTAKGLTGTQGVLIPERNRDALMLRSDVVESIAKGGFHIYTVTTVEEGIELLTGTPAGVNATPRMVVRSPPRTTST